MILPYPALAQEHTENSIGRKNMKLNKQIQQMLQNVLLAKIYLSGGSLNLIRLH